MEFDHNRKTFTVGTSTYNVLPNGTIQNRHGKILKPSLTSEGWPRYTFGGQRYMGAWLVATVYNRPGFTSLHHTDGNLCNVGANNLEPFWDEDKEPLKPAYGKALSKEGDRNPNSRIPLKVKTFIQENPLLSNAVIHSRVARMGEAISVSYIKKLRKNANV